MNERLLEEFHALGCTSPRQAALSLQVYLEIFYVRKYWDVESHFNRTLDRIYFTGKRSRNAADTCFVPIASNEKLSFEKMQTFFVLNDRVCLSICASDSTMVFYEIECGLRESCDAKNVNSIESKRKSRDSRLEGNRRCLEEAAMYGLPVNLGHKSKMTRTE